MTSEDLLVMINNQIEILGDTDDVITVLFTCYTRLLDLEMELENDSE